MKDQDTEFIKFRNKADDLEAEIKEIKQILGVRDGLLEPVTRNQRSALAGKLIELESQVKEIKSNLDSRLSEIESLLNDILLSYLPAILEKQQQYENIIKNSKLPDRLPIIRIGYTKRTYTEYLQVQKLAAKGVSLNKMAQMLNRPYSTIRNYVYASPEEVARLKEEAKKFEDIENNDLE
jgi:DNA-binding transcriptional MerR regulator